MFAVALSALALAGTASSVPASGGRAVSRSYDGCCGGTVQRWARLLGV
jgi:hypothetical protein